MIKESVSILVPIYNLESSISDNIEFLIKSVSPFLDNFEIILSNDGSSDNTHLELERLKNKYDNIKVFNAVRNYGKGHALKRALELSDGEYIVFCDSDMELNPSMLTNFFDIMQKENADIVIGSKRHKDSLVNYSRIRKVISFVYFLVVKIFFSLPIKDTQTGLKLFKRSAIIGVFPRVLVRRFAYDLEVLVACNLNNKKIVSSPVILNPNRNFGFIPIQVLWSTFVDTLAVFYRFHFLSFYKNLFLDKKDLLSDNPLVSIIISAKALDGYVIECITYILNQSYQSFEVIVLLDDYEDSSALHKVFSHKSVILKKTGSISKCLKIGSGVLSSTGSIIAFLDQNTYPEVNWLENALRAMRSYNVASLVGVSASPPHDTFLKSITGLIYSSRIMFGKMSLMYTPYKVQYVNDFIISNFFMTRELYNSVSKIAQNDFWCEGSILSKAIIKSGEKTLYSPEALVYQHKETLFFGHFKQIKNYAFNKGLLMRHMGIGTLNASYLIPSLLTLYLASLMPILYSNLATGIKYTYSLPLCLYMFFLILSAITPLSPVKGIIKALGILCSHITYGVFFVKGFLSSKGNIA